MSARWDEVRALRRARPRSRVVRASVVACAGIAAASWLSGAIETVDLLHERRWANVRRFLSKDALPASLREEGVTPGGLLAWAGEAGHPSALVGRPNR